MNQIEIKKALQTDFEVIQTIGRQTFFETFADCNSEENMQKYLSESFSIDRLTNELNDPNVEFYLAIEANRPIGYLKINYGSSQTENLDNEALEVERIYVIKEFHGKKAGQLLYNKAMEIAIQRNAAYIWLGVWEHNEKAIRFYQKNGFVEFNRHNFILGNDVQTDIMMKIEL